MEARETVDAVYRAESRRVLATLIRLLGDFDRAEEAMHDAFIAAVEKWPSEGVPENPRAWLVSTGRFKAIDVMRRRARFDAALGELASRIEALGCNIAAGDAGSDELLVCVCGCFYDEILVGTGAFALGAEECGCGSWQRLMLGGSGVARQRVDRAVTRKQKLHPVGKLVARNGSVPQTYERERRERSCYVPHPTR